jgi:hypothetical protein
LSTVDFHVKMTMDLEEWQDHCWGSGWTVWEWWYAADVDDLGIRASWYEDCDDPESKISSGHLTWQQIADECSELAATDGFVADQLARSDFDADGMDRVMQHAFIGEIRYG